MRPILSARPSDYATMLTDWVADGCPYDAFFKYENDQGRMTGLGLPEWAHTIHRPPFGPEWVGHKRKR